MLADWREKDLPFLVSLYNILGPKPIQVFRNQELAIKKVDQQIKKWNIKDEDVTGFCQGKMGPLELMKSGKNPYDAKFVEDAEPPKRKRRGGGGRGHRKYSNDQIIRLRVSSNPKRVESAAHARFALYKDRMSIKDFLDAGGRSEDILWDLDKEFIELEGENTNAMKEGEEATIE